MMANPQSIASPADDEEIELLRSMGLLDLLNEPNSSSSEAPQHLQSTNDRIDSALEVCDHVNENDIPPSARAGLWSRFRNLMRWSSEIIELSENAAPTNAQLATNTTSSFNQTKNISSENLSLLFESNSGDERDITSKSNNTIMLGIGGTLFLLPHLAILLSLPPVLQRRGAPYLPTFKSKLNVMFDLIRIQIKQQSHPRRNLQFVDLGSGDGRVVFRAAREGLFHKSVGFEINPTLHLFAQARKLMSPKYWHTTRFQCGDLWKIQLSNYDVVAVYGLAPIMDRLGTKMKEELKPGAIVVSNVFQIPGWRSVSNCKNDDGTTLVGKGIYLYKVPECFGDDAASQS
ncbi:hypothetical protein ACHAWO_001871 [Cyclotella atomus]|jgi:hypothetical protein|uniref:DOT1 domain-containing protein n=1 Tax=Cyclotella atomus TaxID=382360 RepID=A0ABD3Q1C9_9STRA